MTENYFLYIIPSLDLKKASLINPEESGWEKIGKDIGSTYPDPTYYSNYNKKIDYNGYEWSITFRKYQKINSAVFIIKCLNGTYTAESFTDSDNTFISIKKECGVSGLPVISKYILKFFEDSKSLSDEKRELSYLFSEIHEENEFHYVNESCYNIRLNFDEELTKNIKENIFSLLSLSECAYEKEHELLTNENINREDIIKAFWHYKSSLLRSPASQKFPLLFKNNMLAINNMLDYCYVDLADNQNKLLGQIHTVESGILYLTVFVILDVMFHIISKIMKDFKIVDEGYSTIIALVLAFVISILIYHLISKKKTMQRHNSLHNQ